MANLGWREQSSWTWTHVGLQETLSLRSDNANWRVDLQEVRRMLRESWRRTCFGKWLRQSPRDSRECSGIAYNSRAVTTGAQVSPAALHRMKPSTSLTCPWRKKPDVVAAWDHCAWECPDAPGPPQVTAHHCIDGLQKGMGWPSGDPNRKDVDVAIHTWLATLRARCLNDRYK